MRARPVYLLVLAGVTSCSLWRTPSVGPSPGPGPQPPARSPSEAPAPIPASTGGDQALRLAIVAWRAGAWTEAQALGDRAAATGASEGSFVAGLAAQQAGDPPGAIARLAPWGTKAPPSLPGVERDEAEIALRVTLAEAHAASGAAPSARAEWQRLAGLRAARPHEVAYARARLAALATLPPPPAATAPSPRPAPGSSVALLAPLTGPAQVLGERLTRAALLALEPSPGVPAPAPLLLRDPGEGDAGAALREAGVVALAAAGERAAVERAAQQGLLVLALSDLGALPPGVFSIVHTPEARAQALARHALETGARAFAILGPESPAALRQSDAFRVAVIAGGGQLVASSTYAPAASSFGAAVAPLKRAPVDAVFVPDDAEKLELVAPALAAADLWPRPWPPPATSAGAPAKDQRRPILLLSTALRPGPALLRNAGRYVQGALFAPGFIPEPEDPVVTAFVDSYRASFRQEPGASDAYGYDAVSLLSAAVTLGARTPEAVAAHLARASFRGVTGPVRFGSDRRRSDPPAVFVVEGDALRRRR